MTPRSKTSRPGRQKERATRAPPRRATRPVELDRADQQIIDSLIADGRISNRALAGRVGLTEATVAARIRSLQEHRVLGISAVFDWEAAGYAWDLRLAVTVEGRPVLEVAEQLATLRYVNWVMLVFGPADIVVHAQLPDRRAVVDLLTAQVSAIHGIREVRTDLNLETLKYEVNLARVPLAESALEFPAPVVDLDDLDHSIVAALVADGRQSNREIARQLGVSDGTVRLRLRRLGDSGMLRICAQIDPYLTGRVGAWAYVAIDLSGADMPRVAAELAAMPEVLILSVTTGDHDLVAFTVAPSRAALVDVVLDEIRAIRGIRTADTAEVTRTVKLEYRWARLL
ncbi:MAG: hypothetical protein JJLCMIEE_01115 [Acidimicrobiales bacterium]|nr:MAG: Lrp/AsnC family transcriptional regulator [Actinomycetota bacterium]MBV6508056.1 hypothetical protein [Acidimicrobiales bacterium]RIK05317.1 MAG: hypothetical protein DCC48_10590 [Acidobacteriota bacterium]